ncbi:glycosyltransferase involved in cell wall biosynthesis [Isoptericola sp. CG 20/1183]|uniref:Glycosyltransferase involved in cell wall biosynthesis n=1 Tax=Isoptericola halotolerans TaxID=300560 RepID=A0ABX5EDS4_9MICO|nr:MULTISPECIES: glycosyltransferase family 2 protein [Isoptericola]PRZ06549.1 glycosyltransferase involved in cell wall biosynthesis [Isoptericola halotolerans]PRZ06645.1 glycosyltransferase involved in cell wall biosynthesis [Isoptericola sp. CG 20/1183]
MTVSRPQVSVVVPARDAAGHLPDALGSLQRQDLDLCELEVVVVDDGSTDDTLAVLEEASSRLPALRWVHHRTPQGVSAARNRGVREARGRWVTFLDPDDWYFPGHLAAMLDAAERYDVDFLVCDQVQAYGHERRRVRAPEPRRHVPLDPRTGIMPTSRSTMVNYVQVSSRFLSRRVVDDGLAVFDEHLPTAEDREWAWRLLLGTHRYAVVDAPGYVYRRAVTGSLTDVGDARQLGFLEAYDTVLERLRRDGLDEYEPKVLRDVLAVLHHHVSRRSAYPADVWDAMTARARQTVGRFDKQVVARQVAALGPERVRAVRKQGVPL